MPVPITGMRPGPRAATIFASAHAWSTLTLAVGGTGGGTGAGSGVGGADWQPAATPNASNAARKGPSRQTSPRGRAPISPKSFTCKRLERYGMLLRSDI